MISEITTEIAVNLAEIITDKNIKLVPKGATLLSKLSTVIKGNVLAQGEIWDTDYTKIAIKLASTGTTNDKKYIQSEHDTYMDNYIEDLSKLVSNYISYSRNVVKAEMSEFKDSLTSRLEGYKYKHIEDLFNKIFYSLPSVLTSSNVSTEIKQFNDTRYMPNDAYIQLSMLDEEGFDLVAYLLIGIPEDDLVIKQWVTGIEGYGRHYLDMDTHKVFSLNFVEAIDYHLVNYLFYRNLAERSDLNTKYSIAETQSRASSLRNYYGYTLKNLVHNYEGALKRGDLLVSGLTDRFSVFGERVYDVYILEENFEKLAEAGCNIEVLLGYLTSTEGNKIPSVETLVEGAENYLSIWDNTRSLYILTMADSKSNIYKNIIIELYKEHCSESKLAGDLLEFTNNNRGYLEQVKLEGLQYVDDLKPADMDDVDDIILTLIAGIKYRMSNAYYILSNMCYIMDRDEKILPEEAALYAALYYVTDYLLEQADVVTI